MYTIFRTLLLTLVYLLVASPAISADRVYLDITTTETRKIKIAVPWFQNKNLPNQKQKMGRDLADTLAKALKFHGIISIIPTSEYGGAQNANWASLGADYAILAQYSATPNAVKFEMRLYDVAGQEVIMGKSFSGNMQ